MKIILTSIAIAFVIAVVAGVVLNTTQKPAYQVYATQSVRVGDPGHNLVGENWSGNPQAPRNG